MAATLKPLASQVIVITGATSGIGLTTARMAARKGAKLVLAARDQDALDQLVDELKRQGADSLAVPTDVGVRDEVTALGSAAIQRFGHIDTWVNNAGIPIYGRNHVGRVGAAARHVRRLQARGERIHRFAAHGN